MTSPRRPHGSIADDATTPQVPPPAGGASDVEEVPSSLAAGVPQAVEVASTGAQEPREGGVGRNVTALAAAQLITWTMTLLWTLVVPRALGPTGLGHLMAAWAVTGILATVAGLGTRNYLVRESVVDFSAAPRLIGTALILRIGLVPIVIGGAVAYGELAGWEGDAKTVLYLAAAATIFIQLAEPLLAGFQATEHMQFMAYSDVISKSGQGLVGIAVVLLGGGLIGVAWCWVVMTGLVVLLDLYWLRRYIRVEFRTNLRRIVQVVRDSFPYWAFGLFFVLYLWIDFVLLSVLTRAEVVGWYSVPMRLFQTMMFLPVVVSTAWLPRYVRSYEHGDEALGRTARTPTELVLLLSIPICALTAVSAEPVIHVLYGRAYDESVPVMMILGLCIPPMYLGIMLSQIVIAMNRQAWWTWVMVGATVVNPILNFTLIPLTQSRFDNGALGAATSLFLTELIAVGAGLVLVGGLVFDRDLLRRVALAILAGVVAAVVGIESRAFVGSAASIVGAGLAFVGLAALLRIPSPQDLALMKSMLRAAAERLQLLRRRMGSGPTGVPPSA